MWRENVYTPKSQAHSARKPFDAITKSEVVVDGVWKRSTAVNEALQFMKFLFKENIDSPFTDSTRFARLKDGNQLLLCKLQVSRVTKVLEQLT